jgi:hypothetical protein
MAAKDSMVMKKGELRSSSYLEYGSSIRAI